MIKTCDCRHEYQDEKYGKGKRVFNKGIGSKDQPIYRCTVCGQEASGFIEVSKKKK